ncbi:MAG: hypothetical protein L6R41_001259 [Letrouitia leprolyta]|nr:MAG: hypothetical protein L6R41_001259 [Letrouitia leprolyta]
MAGPLGVSHLVLFSKSATGNTNLRLALIPRGPTLHFRVEKYSLCKDVQRSLRHPKGGGKEYLNPPLLVMNNLLSSDTHNTSTRAVPRHLETLITTIFQSLFPAISPQITPLSSVRRVLLLNRELSRSNSTASDNQGHQYVVDMRHYSIVTKPTGLSKGVRRISVPGRISRERKARTVVPNLGKLEDVADYIIDPSAASVAFTSGSESEVETDAEVEVLETNRQRTSSMRQVSHQDKSGVHRNRVGTYKRAVRLVELGPRMKLRMTKVEEGVCGGKVMWHEYLSKSESEARELEEVWETRKREKAERKRVQKENVERKRKLKTLETKDVHGIHEDSVQDPSGYNSENWDSEVSDAED